jgi:Domain of unknown function (DUF4390)
VHTTAFSTAYYERLHRRFSGGEGAVRPGFGWRSFWCLLWCTLALVGGLLGTTAHAADAATADVSALRVERADDGLYLSATLAFELPAAVEEALLKGIAMTFVSEADVYRDRWYWYDKRVATATRSVRVAFQPLTRRWRINVVSGTVSSPATGIALTQHFDSLSDVMAVLRRISRWKIADLADIDADSRHNIDYRFKLDLLQLPRPLQIGVVGQSEWSINAQRNVRPETRVELRPDAR